MNTANNTNDNELDKAFRSALDDRRMPVPPAIWANVRATALEKQLIKTRILNNWLKGATALLAASLALALYFLGKQSVSPATGEKSVATSAQQQPVNPVNTPATTGDDLSNRSPFRSGLPMGMTTDHSKLAAIDKHTSQPTQESTVTAPPRPDSKLSDVLSAQAVDEAVENNPDSERTVEPALAPTKNRADEEMPDGSEMFPVAPESESNLIINSQPDAMHQPDGSSATYQPVLMPQTPAGAYPMAPIRSVNEPPAGTGQPRTLQSPRSAIQSHSWSSFSMFDYLAPLLPKSSSKHVNKKNRTNN